MKKKTTARSMVGTGRRKEKQPTSVQRLSLKYRSGTHPFRPSSVRTA